MKAVKKVGSGNSPGGHIARAREDWSLAKCPSSNSQLIRTDEPYTAAYGGHTGHSLRRLHAAIDVRRVVARNDKTGYLMLWFFSETKPAWASLPSWVQRKLPAEIRAAKADIRETLGGKGGYRVE